VLNRGGSNERKLGAFVEQEARRARWDEQIRGDPRRLADGWKRRFIADPERAKEAVELYTQLGYEVAADPVRPEDLGDDCEDCELLARMRFAVIYTRRREA
jgi:hypothetical protein